MPQLNPEPWFLILLLSWAMFLIFIPPKILAHSTLKDPNIQSTEKSNKEMWNWPWQ
uniref:ATP synthase complex subunit 8 n=1 Tax=Epiplatys dageti TaxID=1573755 RepID=A0A517U734_9TELE|nr:ATP synthase F0 subunit 8 [Epiplatys dageti]QDT76512.1 ATP synthase F0 subunit 8 [Epiplatys dageti]